MSLPNMNTKEGKERYQLVRAGLIVQGTTLTHWCRENGTCIQNVRDAFFGRWQGPKATDLTRRVLQAAGAKTK